MDFLHFTTKTVWMFIIPPMPFWPVKITQEHRVLLDHAVVQHMSELGALLVVVGFVFGILELKAVDFFQVLRIMQVKQQ